MGGMDDTGSNLTVQDFVDDIEDMDSSFDVHGECALIKLKNGGYAWGSQVKDERTTLIWLLNSWFRT